MLKRVLEYGVLCQGFVTYEAGRCNLLAGSENGTLEWQECLQKTLHCQVVSLGLFCLILVLYIATIYQSLFTISLKLLNIDLRGDLNCQDFRT